MRTPCYFSLLWNVCSVLCSSYVFLLQANLAVQEARLQVAMGDLATAQAQLDAKEAELRIVQAEYDKAMSEKQVYRLTSLFLLEVISTSNSFPIMESDLASS